MIEIRNHSGSRIYGCCSNMKAAQIIISDLIVCGTISVEETTLTIRHYKNRICQRVSEVRFIAGKWRPITRDRHGKISQRASTLAA
jgi:hypothetical protein